MMWLMYQQRAIHQSTAEIVLELAGRFCSDNSNRWCWDAMIVRRNVCAEIVLELAKRFCSDILNRWCWDATIVRRNVCAEIVFELAGRFCSDISNRWCWDATIVRRNVCAMCFNAGALIYKGGGLLNVIRAVLTGLWRFCTSSSTTMMCAVQRLIP